MPILSGGTYRTVTLPESGATVTLRTLITAGIAVRVANSEQDEVTRFLAVLAELIQSWDFTDSEGNPVSIDEDSIKYLAIADFSYLADLVGATVQQQVDSGKLQAEVKKV